MTRRFAAELGAVVLGLALWSYVGWDSALWDPRWQLGLHLGVAVAVIGVFVIARRGGVLPRTRLDLPIAALLVAFAVACLSAWNAGLSTRALAAILGTVTMLPVALLVLRHRPSWTALVVAVPIIGLAAGTLVVLVGRRIEWIAVGAPGLPPVRLAAEGTPFGSVAVPPFILLAALPLALLVQPTWLRRAILGALLVLGVPLTLLSGSRSSWIAIAVAGIVLAAPLAPRLRLPGRWTVRSVGLVLAIGVAVVLALAFVAPRLTDIGSLIYRGHLWRDTLAAVDDPIFGIGPGSMPWARQAAAPPLSFPAAQPHSHDVLLGIFGDAGALGVAAALVVFGTFVRVAGPWCTSTLAGRAAFAVLMGFAAGMFFEDLTFLPNFNLLVLLLVAIALADAGAVRWVPARMPPGWRLGGAIAVAALLVPMLVGDAAAIAYRVGVDDASVGDWHEGQTWLELSVFLDPWHPAGPKAMTVIAERNDDLAVARSAAAEAVARNPGDGQSWTNLSLLCVQASDRSCAARAAGQAEATAVPGGRELANAALVEAWLGDLDAADRAYRLSLVTNQWTGLTLPWPRAVIVGDIVKALPESPSELTVLIARRVTGESIVPDDYRSPLTRALAYAMLGNQQAATSALADAERAAPGVSTTWAIAALLTRHWGGDATRELEIYATVAGRALSSSTPASRPAPTAAVPLEVRDIAAFRWYPGDGLVRSAERLRPSAPFPWAFEVLLTPPAAAGG